MSAGVIVHTSDGTYTGQSVAGTIRRVYGRDAGITWSRDRSDHTAGLVTSPAGRLDPGAAHVHALVLWWADADDPDTHHRRAPAG